MLELEGDIVALDAAQRRCMACTGRIALCTSPSPRDSAPDLTPFELLQPASLGEALSLLDDEGAQPFAGGTALMLMMKAGVLRPSAW